MAKMPATSFLETFKLVPVDVREAAKGEPIVIARKRVIEGIKAQKDAVEKELGIRVPGPSPVDPLGRLTVHHLGACETACKPFQIPGVNSVQ